MSSQPPPYPEPSILQYLKSLPDEFFQESPPPVESHGQILPSPIQRAARPARSASYTKLSDQQKFLLFVKILFRYLERTDNMRLRQRAKRVVAECTRRNRSGDLRYMPLREAVEDHLRVTVGNEFYSRVQNYCEYYCAKKGFNPTVAAV